MPGPVVLSVDIGTSSVRAGLFTAAARPLAGAQAQVTYRMRVTADGGVEGDAVRLFACAAAAIDRVQAASSSGEGRIAAVALSTFWHSVMAVHADGAPLTPLYTWADTRSADDAARLRQCLHEGAVHSRTGCMLRSSYVTAKLAWIRRLQPGVFRQARWWISIGEYLLLRLFGVPLSSLSMASATGLLDQHRIAWDPEVLRALDLDAERLPPLAAPRQELHGLRSPFARRWPALRDVPWFPALGDGACSNIGAGATTPRRAAVMIGTSGAMRVLRRATRFEIPPGLWVYRVDQRRILVGGALSNGGNAYDWLQATLRLPPASRAERAVAAMPPDSHGLTVLPLLAGERSPGWADHAAGAVAGLTLFTRPRDILRAGMEAVCYPFAILERMLTRAVPGPRRLIATGGGLLQSPLWMQILADVLGKPVTASAEWEGSSRGAALMALETLGAIARIEDVPARTGRTFTPDRRRHTVYQRAIARQRELYHSLISTARRAGVRR